MIKKYAFKYQIILDDNDGNGFKEDEVEKIESPEKLVGLMDGAIFVPISKIKKNKDDYFYKLDSRVFSKRLDGLDEFCVWCLMAEGLLENTSLPTFVRDIYEDVIKRFRKCELLKKEEDDKSL